MTSDIVIRKCQALEEFRLCLALQKEIWQEADLETEPVTAFIVAANTGGQVLGAFDGGRLAGFTLAVVGLRDGIPYLHSHMTGVHGDYRDRGVGRALKLFQRDEALGRNIRLICWTFDPLEFRNAYFNFNRLGAISRKYLPNFYGITTSPLHRGIATDRLLTEWYLDSPRVDAAVAGVALPGPQYSAVLDIPPGHSRPSGAEHDEQEVADQQARLRQEFSRYFSKGYAAVGVRNDPQAPAYLLSPWSEF